MLNVAVFSSLFVVHGVLLVRLVEPSGRAVAAAAGDARWRGILVDVAALGAAVITAAAVVSLGVLSGWPSLVMIALVVCPIGLAVIDPERARP